MTSHLAHTMDSSTEDNRVRDHRHHDDHDHDDDDVNLLDGVKMMSLRELSMREHHDDDDDDEIDIEESLDADDDDMSVYEVDRLKRNRQICLGVMLVTIVFVVVVLVLALTVLKKKKNHDHDWQREFLKIPDPLKVDEHMRMYTSYPTLAGTVGSARAANATAKKWSEFGIPQVEISEYKVLLSFPVRREVRIVSSVDGTYSAVMEEASIAEDPTSGRNDTVMTFNGYAASGNVTGALVYVNYGRLKDYERLVSLGFNLTGRIAIARYGRIFRGLKAMIGEKFGIAGLLIYSDPKNDGFGRDGGVYPNGPWRPRTSVQRGAAAYISLFSGDPLTPGVAATVDLQTREFTENNSPILPKIPIQPLSWGDAQYFLRVLRGDTVLANAHTHSWQGGLSFTYSLGTRDVSSPSSVIVNMDLEIVREIRSIYDVIGKIPESPDSSGIIVVGNHRDAWVYGAADPHGGSSALMEIARAYGTMYRKGWRPRHGIVLASWDAEEQGLIGSTEWVEEHQATLRTSALAYVNVDVGVSGKKFKAEASPLLNEYIRRASAKVVDLESGKTLQELWKVDDPDMSIGALGSGSDYSAFLQYQGISSCDLRFRGDYGVYHSNYDSYTWMSKFGDPGWHYTAMLAKMLGVLVMDLSGAKTLEYSHIEYAKSVTDYVRHLNSTVVPHNLEKFPDISPTTRSSLNEQLELLSKVCDLFRDAARTFEDRVKDVIKHESSDHSQSRALNEQSMLVERKMLSSRKLPNRDIAWYRHAIYAPKLYGGYDAVVLPGVTEAAEAGEWDEAVLQAQALAVALEKVVNTLKLVIQQ